MGTTHLQVVDANRMSGSPSAEPVRESWDVELTARFRAERRKLSRVLSIPEYLETWLAVPDAHAHSLAAHRHGSDFTIEWRTAGGLEKRIEGTYRAVRPTRVVMSWNVDEFGARHRSVVRFSLCGEFEYTRVNLMHTGLTNESESMWHRQLWGESLGRLTRLYC